MLIKKQPNDSGVVFAVQSTGISATNASESLAGLQDQTVYEFGIIPFTQDITGLDDFPKDGIVIPLGGTKLLELSAQEVLPFNWHLFYDPYYFQYSTCGNLLEHRMLNWGASYTELGKVLDQQQPYDIFIKPDNDQKMFTGLVVPKGRTLREELAQTMHQQLDATSRVVISDVQQILAEYRVIVSHGAIIGMSQYRKNDRLDIQPVTDPDTIIRISAFVGTVMERFLPVPVYTVDVADVPNEFMHRHPMRVVEINCFNCSGFYEIDRQKMFNTIHRDVVEYWRT